MFGKLSEESIGGERSTTYADDSSSGMEPGEDNHDELDLPEAQFHNPSNYIETPMASPYMETDLSGIPIFFENRLTCPSEDRFDDFATGNLPVNNFNVNFEMHIPTHIPAPPTHVAPAIIQKELIS